MINKLATSLDAIAISKKSETITEPTATTDARMLVHPPLRWSSVYLVVFSPAAMFTAQRRNLFSLLISSSPEEEEVIVVVATIAPSSSKIRVASVYSFGHLSLDTMKYAVNFVIVLSISRHV